MTAEPKPNFVAEYYMVRVYGERVSFVMVEGETDEEVWDRFAATECRFFPSEGKDNIIEALTASDLREMPGIAGIIDLDYSLITGSYARNVPNLLYDDCCPDMESILLSSPALKKVFRHTFDNVEIDEIHGFADELTQESLRLAMEFGYFRWLNDCNDCGINFSSFEYSNQPGFINFGESDFIDIDALQLRRKWTTRRLTESSKDQINWEDLLRDIEELRVKHPPNNIQLCRGKDVVAIMAFILPRLYESRFGDAFPKSAQSLLREWQLAKELRKAYEYIYFQETALFGCIRNWECANEPYKILKTAI